MIGWLIRWFLFRPLSVLVAVILPPIRGRRPAVLRLRIAGRLVEAQPRPLPFVPVSGSLVGEKAALLRAAAESRRIVGVRIDLGRLDAGMAKVQELRRAIQALRARGKHVHVHLEGGGLREYLLACAADRISMPPLGTLDLVGLRGETTYLGGLMSTLGIHPDFEAVGDYKSFAERFVRSGPTRAARRNSEAIVEDVWDQLVAAVASARNLDPATAEGLLGGGPFGAEEAVEAGLIDRALYPDRIRKAMRRSVGKHRVVKGGRFWSRTLRIRRWSLRARREPMVAVLPAVGQIMPGSVRNAPGNVIGARTMIRQLEALRRDRRVAAVVLRIDSPGGSAEASDLIWRSVQRLAKAKPVVASMGDVAASGGYYIAMGADAVLAEPGTLTGSIGVVAGKLNLAGLYDKLGIQRDVISVGEHSGFYATTTDFTAAERERLQARMEEFYRAFVDKAAQGRGVAADELERHARGRVWTGRQALERDLVDGLGGMHDATTLASELAGYERPLRVGVMASPSVPLWWPGRWLGGARSWLSSRIPALDWLALPELRSGGLLARLPFDLKIF